jgi:hypothetical protein
MRSSHTELGEESLRRANRNSALLALVALLVGPLFAAPAAAAGLATQIRQLTGAETRIVWIRHKQWEGQPGDHLDGGAGYSIMAFDTEEKKGERELVPEGELFNPLISPNGDRVIYSSGSKTDNKYLIHCVDWNGANSRVLSDGYGMCLWRDPATGIEWVYASNNRYGNLLDRFQIDNPKVREKLYTGDKSHRLSLSADGTRAAGEFPWPHASVLYFRTGQVDRKNYRTGCNVYMSPDNSYMVSIMDGGHTRVTLYKADGSSRDISVAPPGLKPLKNGGRGVVWNPKWASDVRYMSVAGPFTNLKPDRADIWLGRFADDFNSIPSWVQVTDNDYMDNYAYVWVRPRGMKGKRPDGKAGASKKGDRKLEGTVSAADRVAPKLLSAAKLNDRRVLLTCSEPVRIGRAIVTRTDGTPAVKLGLDSEESGIIAEFAAPLAAEETLTVAGVTDRARAPNRMAAAKAQIVQPDWPSNRAGVSYLWKNARTRDVIFDERIRLPVTTALISGGEARFNREGAAMAAGGTFAPGPGSAERIVEGIKKTHQFSFEIVVASADLAQAKGTVDEPLAIFNWGYGWRRGLFWLLQEKNLLQVGLSTQSGDGKPEVFEMAALPDTKPHHLIVSIAAKRLAFYLDGKKVKEIDPSPASFIEAGAPPMRLAENAWRGQFEYLAMYDRFIEEPEAAKNAAVVAADLATRKALPRIEVRATLIGMSKIPEPREITPYRNALVVNEYSVEKVLKGTYTGKTLRVAQWGMLDLKPTPLAALKPGTSVKLVLERFADHDELVPELISDTLKENFDLILYTDVNL